MTTLTIQVSDELARELEALAAKKGATLEDLGRIALVRYLAHASKR